MNILRTEFGMKVKDILRPIKHKIFGKSGIYKVIELLDNPKLILDIGAAIGETAIPMAKAFPKAKILCFEPVQWMRLTQRVGKYKNIGVFNVAIADELGSKEIMIPKHQDASSFVKCFGEYTKIEIPSTTLDESYLFEEEIDLIKIDVEGAELEVLRGAKETLKNTKSVYIEINHELVDMDRIIETFKLLHEAGFKYAGNMGDFYFTRK